MVEVYSKAKINGPNPFAADRLSPASKPSNSNVEIRVLLIYSGQDDHQISFTGWFC